MENKTNTKSKTNEGKKFEEDIKKSAQDQNVYILRLKDSAQSFTANSCSNFSWNNPCDFIIYGNSKLFMVECKSTKGTSIPFTMIKDNQIEGLLNYSKYKGVVCGFLFNFRGDNELTEFGTPKQINTTYWLKIEDFIRFRDKTTKKSINQADICEYGGLVLDGDLVRTRYKYDIKSLVKYGDY